MPVFTGDITFRGPPELDTHLYHPMKGEFPQGTVVNATRDEMNKLRMFTKQEIFRLKLLRVKSSDLCEQHPNMV